MPVDPDLALFASWVRDEEQKERDAKAAQREARRAADESARVVAAKDAAAAELKRVRSDSRATPEQRAAAEAAYRDALAAVVAAETGEAPAWAPAPAEPEAGSDAEEPEAGSTDEPTDEAEPEA